MAKKPKERSRTDRMLDDVRAVLSRWGDIPEREMYEALMSEAEGWKMRLEELDDEAADLQWSAKPQGR